MFPPCSSEEPKVDLCQFVTGELQSSIVFGSYVFNSTKYFGEKSLNDIRRDLLLSAKHGGFDLTTQSCGVTKLATGVKKRLNSQKGIRRLKRYIFLISRGQPIV